MTTLSTQDQNQIESKSCQVLAIGTPIVDYLITVSDDEMRSIPGVRGGSILVDHETFQKLFNDQHQPLKLIAGGSAANTLKGLAQLGHACSFFGKIGNDETGKKFLQDIETYGVLPHLSLSTLPTARSACLITPDHERTMRTFIGAGAEMNESDLTPELFKGVQLVHIEGYLMNRKGFVEKAMTLAKEAGAKISFDISSFEIAEEYKKPMIELLTNFVNITFANEEEAHTLTGLPPEKACMLLKDLCDIAVVKMGGHGCLAATGSKKAFHQAFEVDVVDTTGAGDLFASGFLHGFLSNRSLEECLQNGSFIASKVIQMLGAEIPKNAWPDIKKNL